MALKYFILKTLVTSLVTDNILQWLKIQMGNSDLTLNTFRSNQIFYVKFLAAEQYFPEFLSLKG